ncbi:hypothetical protein GS501_04230 [Saccharibacter sp. 17.LH.SD]|uniref:hypothetical protein n=1 Tax=Saccharibacter sp. 17.LH.SD TaxID=2689393 RepID=UPI0013704238|nr:hypothetical protein [Saccharibacter sp. 17.LH.SD]MXV44258.1 hypothetical protein [Saccharibacter sp. 17.LH.SD]
MKKLSLVAVALAGLTVASAPAFAAHHGHHHGHHHGKKCAMKKGDKKAAPASGEEKGASDDLNASSLQKAQTPVAPSAPAAPAAPAAPGNMPAPQSN